jgi:hypothetical protein
MSSLPTEEMKTRQKEHKPRSISTICNLERINGNSGNFFKNERKLGEFCVAFGDIRITVWLF